MTENLTVNLKRLDTRVQAELREFMYDSAERIKELAQLNAPVDNHHVEGSIEVEVNKFAGINRAHTVSVGVNKDKLRQYREAAFGDGYQHFDYDVWLHEATYELGPESKDKNDWVRSFHPRAAVGNKFLERAMLVLKPSIERRAQDHARKIIEREKAKR